MKACMVRLSVLTLVALSAACSNTTEEGRKAPAGDPPSAAAAPAAPEAARASGVPLEKRLADIGALTDLIVAAAADLPRAEFEPAALVAKIGKDPQKLFEWVRDRTWWAPYRGLLRGAQGVMLDRVGSSLDRAVLLGDLLRRAGYTVRLAHAEIPETRARELLGKVRPMPAQRRGPVAPREVPAERKRAMAALMPGYEEEMEKQLAEAKRMRGEAEALVRSQTEMLLAAVRDAARPDAPLEESAAVAALRDHWWVEREDGGKWVAMDVLLPDAKAGEVHSVASSRGEWPAKADVPSIPDSEWHTVHVRVIIERYEAGKTSESTVLESLLRPAEVLDRPVTLSHLPLPWPAELPDSPDNPQSFREAALAVKEWVPLLRIGHDVIVQSGFTIAGDLDTKLEETLSDISKGDMSRVGGIQVAGGMDMALGGFSADEPMPAATAGWIDYEIRVPGAPSRRLRRPVFDLLGPARRASKAADFDGTADLRKLERFEALWSQTDILLQPCEFTGEFIAHLAATSVLAEQKALKELTRERDPVRVQELAAEIFGQLDLWGPLRDLTLWRSALGGQAGEWIIDGPNVLNYRGGRAVVNAERVTYRELIDVAHNVTGTRHGGTTQAFEVRVRQGVIDTVAEMLALGSELSATQNTASVFGRLAAENSRGLLIGAHDQTAAKALPWPEDEAARVAADVDAGFMVLVPRKAVLIDGEPHVGWWRVDPATGETIGVMDTGFHAATSFYAKLSAAIGVAAPLLTPANLQRAQRLQGIASHWGRNALTAGQRNFIDLVMAARLLEQEVIDALGG